MENAQPFQPPQIETPRLLLRRIAPSDAEDIFVYARDPELTKYTSWDSHTRPEDSENFVRFMLQKYETGSGDWVLVLKETGSVVGTCGFVRVKPQHRKAELGYVLSRKLWGNGLMTEAVRAIIDYGFNSMKLHRIEAKCMAENAGSERVMQKSGMSYEGIMRGAIFRREIFWNMKCYAILVSDRIPRQP
jgi:ribosomal-protein-alanine N-acetyltransferase